MCCEISSQAKVNFHHIVVPGAVVPHGFKYLACGPKVMLHKPFLDGLPSFCQNPSAHTLREDLEEGDRFNNSLEIRLYVDPTAKFEPLVARLLCLSGILWKKPLCERLMFSMEFSCRIHPYGRGSIFQEFC